MKKRSGFTLVEMMIALVLLMIVVLGMATTTGRFIRVVAESDRQAAAIQLAEDRIQLILMDPDYNGLDTAYAATESNFPTLTGYVRTTQIVRVGGPTALMDYKKITVTVSGPGLPAPVERSITVGAP